MADATEVTPSGCKSCYLANGGFTEMASGRKACSECGGTVLDLQELLDTLADRDSEIRYLKQHFEEWEAGTEEVEEQHNDGEEELDE